MFFLVEDSKYVSLRGLGSGKFPTDVRDSPLYEFCVNKQELNFCMLEHRSYVERHNDIKLLMSLGTE